jgi:hypothetical protein
MASDAALNIVLSAQDQTGPGITSAEGKLAKLKGSAVSLLAVWSTVGLATTTVSGFLSDSAQAAADDAASVDRLRQAMKNAGVDMDQTGGVIDDLIKKNQALAFTDDQTRDSLSLLIAQTGSVDEAMRRLPLAMDLARGAHIDLQTASKLLGKATDENVNVLGRYGITIQKGASQAELFAAIQQKFGGQAVTYGNSTSGSIDKMRDSIDEWKESIGAALGPAQPFLAMLPGLSAGFYSLGLVLGPTIEGVKLFGNTAAFAAIKSGIVRAATLAWTGAQWLLNVALSANPIGLVILAIAALVVGVVWAYKNVGWFHDAVDKAFAGLKEFGGWIMDHLRPILDWLGRNLGNLVQLFLSLASFNISGITGALHNLHVPGFKWGGIVPGPIGAPQLIMAHGGEEVRRIPSSQQVAAVAAPSNTYIYHVHFDGLVYAEGAKLDKLANDLAARLAVHTGR